MGSGVGSMGGDSVAAVVTNTANSVLPPTGGGGGVVGGGISIARNIFDPSQFQPVCPASDGVYQVGLCVD